METKTVCVWCNKETQYVRNAEQGSNGRLRVTRCGACKAIISVRLDSEPDDIMMKLPKKKEN